MTFYIVISSGMPRVIMGIFEEIEVGCSEPALRQLAVNAQKLRQPLPG